MSVILDVLAWTGLAVGVAVLKWYLVGLRLPPYAQPAAFWDNTAHFVGLASVGLSVLCAIATPWWGILLLVVIVPPLNQAIALLQGSPLSSDQADGFSAFEGDGATSPPRQRPHQRQQIVSGSGSKYFLQVLGHLQVLSLMSMEAKEMVKSAEFDRLSRSEAMKRIRAILDDAALSGWEPPMKHETRRTCPDPETYNLVRSLSEEYRRLIH
jgi:hypothetical protein